MKTTTTSGAENYKICSICKSKGHWAQEHEMWAKLFENKESDKE